MKNKGEIWYIGYIVSLFLIVIILVTDFPKMVDIGLAILFSAVFGVSHVQILHDKMMKNDADYKINVMDERNIIIKEKAGNITNMFNTILLGGGNSYIYLFRLHHSSYYCRKYHCNPADYFNHYQ